MLHQFEEYGKCAEITGFRNIDFGKAEAYLKSHRKQANHTELQFFDADLIATQEHLYFAILNALQAFCGETNVSKSVAVEAMLFASAKRQIQRAIEHIGIKLGDRNLAVVIVGDDAEAVAAQLGVLVACFGCPPDETVLQLTKEKQKKIQSAYEITEVEIKTVKGPVEEAIVALIIEHIALLSTQV
jgi:tRNA threonylcarbamoyladenosine modification (KEOPS) complex Cgi121 subunit